MRGDPQRKAAVKQERITVSRRRLRIKQKRRRRRMRKISFTMSTTPIQNFAVSNGWVVHTDNTMMTQLRFGGLAEKSRK